MGALLHLPARDFSGLFPLLLGHHILEKPRADDVGPFAHNQRPVALVGFHQLDARIISAVRTSGNRPGLLALGHLRDRLNVRVGGSAAATHSVEPAVGDEAVELRRDRRGRFQVLPLFVGKAGVRVAGNPHRRHFADGADMVRHELGTGAAVEPDRDQVRMQDRRAKRIRRLSREHCAVGLDGAGNHHGDAHAALAP